MISLINAGPGSGKSFTLIYGYLHMSNKMIGSVDPTPEQANIFKFLKSEFAPTSSVCFFAHNNSTKDNLAYKLPKKTPIFTFHGAGYSTLVKKFGFQAKYDQRTDDFITDLTGLRLQDMKPADKGYWYAIKKLLTYLKLEMMLPTEENFNYLCYKYPALAGVQFPDDWAKRCNQLLDKAAIPNKKVEFVDMLWLGAKKAGPRPVYDVGFVDESQDISQAAYTLVTRLCSHVIFCGDRNQAINAFAGASEEMYAKIEDKSDAVHPLKMSLRNPKYICDMANMVRPGGVIHGPNKSEGEHSTITYASLPEKLRKCVSANTLIISRTNAAIISCCLYLHKQGFSVRIIDRELSDEVKGFIRYFGTKNLDQLKARLITYEQRNSRSKNQLWVQMVADKVAYTLELINSVSTYPALLELIEDTFGNPDPDAYKLTSIHKSKGLEAANIFILNPPVELSLAMEHPIAKEQEINLHFVALTRSALNLYWVK